jgi:WD40 repeat protein
MPTQSRGHGTRRTFDAQEAFMSRVVFHPKDNDCLYSGDWEGYLVKWKVSESKKTDEWREHKGRISGISITSDGKYLGTAGADHTAKLWDLRTGKVHRTLKGHNSTVSAIAFSPDGKTVATSCGSLDEPGELRVWDVEEGTLLKTLR